MSPTTSSANFSHKVPLIVFFSLLLDLLAFTMPLPLFPRLIESFVLQERMRGVNHTDSPTILSRLLSLVRLFRSSLRSSTSLSSSTSHKYDIVLLGGLLGSIFSFCQFLISPHLGKLSDFYGRKPVLLATMVGNIASAALWVGATGFEGFLASRVVGGLSEGNVQLSVAIISDVVPPARRARSLALVGIAFSIAFTLGPSLGAWLSKKLFDPSTHVGEEDPAIQYWRGLKLNVYAVPALITLGLLVTETAILAAWLPETRWFEKKEEVKEGEEKKEGEKEKRSAMERKRSLKLLELIHAGFLFFFSGAEYTLTFLTFDIFSYSNSQNGALLGFIGILSALIQGGYVRRLTKKRSDAPSFLAKSGIQACSVSLLLLTLLPILPTFDSKTSTPTSLGTTMLYLSGALMAYTSATVVNSLTSLASLECDDVPPSSNSDDRETVPKGLYLGRFRSAGQMGRAIGPLFATGVYWSWGPQWAYGVCLLGVVGVTHAAVKGMGWGRRKVKVE